MNLTQPRQDGEQSGALSVPDYYDALTALAVQFQLAIHYGLWGPDTTTPEEAHRRAARTLVAGCDLRPGQRVLDSGCGVGGTAIILAEEYGVRVTGLTICEPHIAVAADQAERRGVGHLVEFRHGDFMDLPFPDSSFDVVVNQESCCYAPDKAAYLRGVFRVLKPGGRWQSLDGYLSGKPMTRAQEELHARMHKGCLTPPWPQAREIVTALAEAGFEDLREQDLTSEVLPAVEKLRNTYEFFMPWPMPASQQKSYEGFAEAFFCFDQGVNEGVFSYNFVAGSRPTQEAPAHQS